MLIGSDAGPGRAGPNQFGDQGGLDGVLAMGWGSGTANMTYLITVCDLCSSLSKIPSNERLDVVAARCHSATGKRRSY